MDESAVGTQFDFGETNNVATGIVGTQFDFGETNNVATGIRTINLEHPIIYAHNNNTLVGT